MQKKIKKIKQFCSDYIENKFGYSYLISDSIAYKLSIFFNEQTDNMKLIVELEKHIQNYLTKFKTVPLYWIANNFVSDMTAAKLYSSDTNWCHCKICKIVYDKSTTNTSSEFCSNDCKIKGKDIRIKKMTESRRNYNYRDPSQYAERNGVTVEEAEKIIRKMNDIQKEKSALNVNYWIQEGYSEEEAKNIISDIQKKRSHYNVQYWISNHNMTPEEAKSKIIEIQKNNNSKKDPSKFRTSSQYCIEYWLERGFEVEQAQQKVEETIDYLKKNYFDLRDNTDSQNKEQNVLCVEFYNKRGIYDKDIIHELKSIEIDKRRGDGKNFTSKIASEFTTKLSNKFSEDKTYYHPKTKEFSIYDSENGCVYFYDFVNLSRKQIVEFNGNYWHSDKNKFYDRKREDRKRLVAEEHGFAYYVIWEQDYVKHKDVTVHNLKEQLLQKGNIYENH